MKKTLLIISTILFSNLMIAQTTTIPDVNFEQKLINMGYDSGSPDGVVLTANISSVSYLDVSWSSISDLTGIEDFAGLVDFDCHENQVSNLDLSQNSMLEFLDCSWNNITNLNVNQNSYLDELTCNNNQLTSINVTQNLDIGSINCGFNQLTSVDVSQNLGLVTYNCHNNQISILNLSTNTQITNLSCYNNSLTCLNIKNGNNINFVTFSAINNSSLTCIEVDDSAWATTNLIWVDGSASFSTNCSNPCSVGIDEYNLNTLSLYPNPTKRKITIDLGKVLTRVNVILTNNLGQIISTQMSESTDRINLEIDAPSGIYFLSIETSNGDIKTIKVLKN